MGIALSGFGDTTQRQLKTAVAFPLAIIILINILSNVRLTAIEKRLHQEYKHKKNEAGTEVNTQNTLTREELQICPFYQQMPSLGL